MEKFRIIAAISSPVYPKAFEVSSIVASG